MPGSTGVDLSNTSNYTLHDILKIGSLRGAECLTGHEGMERHIRRINVVETADIAEWVSKGELILTSGYAFRDNPELLRDQLESLQEKGVAGLCMKLTRMNATIPDILVEEASRIHFPLIQLPITAVFANIVQEGMEAILSRRIRDFQDIQAATEVLLSAMWKEQTPESGLQVVEDVFHNPVLIIDEENELMLTPSTRELLDEDAQDRLIRLLYFRNAEEPLVIMENGKERRIPLYVFNNGTPDGMSMILLEYNDPLSDSDWLVLRQVGHSLILEMKNALTIKKIRRRYKNQFVEDLLSGRLGSDPVKIVIDAQADGYHLSTENEYRIVVLNLNLEEDELFRENEVTIIRQIIRNLDTNMLFNVQNGKLTLVQENNVKWEQLVKNLTLLAHKLNFIMKKGNITFCVSDPVSLENMKDGYEQAMKISEIVQRGKRKEQIVTADKLGTMYLLSMVPEKEAEEYVDQQLRALRDYDEAHNASLEDTLRVYLSVNCNKQLAAEALHIHYNTTVYRLGKVEELLGFSLSDAERQFRLRMAMKLSELL